MTQWLSLITEWESHDPGYFSVALFDHREYASSTLGLDAYPLLTPKICLFVMAWRLASVSECSKISGRFRDHFLVRITRIVMFPHNADYLNSQVVALSADCQESTKQLCLSAGMNAFLSKPLKKSASGAISCFIPSNRCQLSSGDLATLLTTFGGPTSPEPPGDPPMSIS